MYVENEAENVDESQNLEQEQDTQETQPTPPVDNGAKAYSERLNKDRERIRNEERESIAQSFGYDDWKSYVEAQQNSKMVDNGLDPEAVRPVIDNLIQNDPRYLEAMSYKREKEELEKQIFAKTSLDSLNSTFGTNYSSIDELDKDTIDLWNSGVPITKAYAANNWKNIEEKAVKKASKSIDNGKSHLTDTTGSNQQTTRVEYSPEQLKVFERMGISADKAKKWNDAQNNK